MVCLLLEHFVLCFDLAFEARFLNYCEFEQIMTKVKIYGKKICSYCQDAKEYFSKIDVDLDYEEVADTKIKELERDTGIDTVPQIFINEKFIGGWVTTKELIRTGELDKLLNN